MTTRPHSSSFLLDNFGWMLGSLMLALIVWYTATAVQNPVSQRRFQDPLTIKVQLDDNMMVVSQDSTSAQVTIRAPESVWNNLNANSISVIADLSKHTPGKYTIDLNAALSPSITGLITEIEPRTVTIELARESEQKVSVTVQIAQEPPVGYTASAIKPDQTTVLISGPEDQVKQVASAQARINLQDQRNHFSQVVMLSPVTSDGKLVSDVKIDPPQTTVDVDIHPRSDVTLLAVIPRFTGQLPAGYLRSAYKLDPDTVVVRGDQAVIDSMNGYISTEGIDLTNKTAGFQEHVKLDLPAGVGTVEPVDVVVTVPIDPVQGTRDFGSVPVQIRGLDPADFDITVQPDQVNVTLSGPQTILDQLTANDISIIAPLDGLSAGKFQVTIQGSVTQSGVQVSIPNQKVDVTIIAKHPTPTPSLIPTQETAAPTSAATQAQ